MPPSKSLFCADNPLHAVIAQYFAAKLIDLLQDVDLKTALGRLSDHQPEDYRRWRVMDRERLERMRAVLMQARLGTTLSVDATNARE